MRNRTSPHRTTNVAERGREEGSLFIMVLLILLILTAVALSLMFITELEMKMGGSERVINQTFFAAESGLHVAVAGLQNQNWNGADVAFVEGPLGPDRLIGTRVRTRNVELVGTGKLPPMTLANELQNKYFSYSVLLTATAERVSWPNTDQAPIYPPGDARERLVTVQSQQTLTLHYLVSPLKKPANPRGPYQDAADSLD